MFEPFHADFLLSGVCAWNSTPGFPRTVRSPIVGSMEALSTPSVAATTLGLLGNDGETLTYTVIDWKTEVQKGSPSLAPRLAHVARTETERTVLGMTLPLGKGLLICVSVQCKGHKGMVPVPVSVPDKLSGHELEDPVVGDPVQQENDKMGILSKKN